MSPRTQHAGGVSTLDVILHWIENDGYISIQAINGRLKRKGYADKTGGTLVAKLVREKKVKRFKSNGKLYAYTGDHLPESAEDLGYGMLKNRRPKAEREAEAPVAADSPEPQRANCLLLVQWGRNRSESLTLDEGRELFVQLSQIFGR